MNRKKISLLLVLTMLVGSILGGCGVNPAKDSSVENGVPEKEGYALDFSTEFNDGKLDEEYWLPQYLPHCTASINVFGMAHAMRSVSARAWIG